MKKIVIVALVLLGVGQLLAGDGLLLNWGFDRGYEFGAFEYDVSGNSNDGVVVWDRVGSRGGVRWAPEQGIIGGAGYLDKDIRGSLRTEEEISLPGEWSMSYWFKPLEDKTRFDGMVLFASEDMDKIFFDLGQNHSFAGRFNNGKQQFNTGFFKGKIAGGRWNHLAMVYENDKVTFYLNGQAVSRDHQLPWNPRLKFHVFFSGANGRPHHRMEGHFDEFRLYGKALGEAEIKRLGNKRFYAAEKRTPVADGGMGYTSWLEKRKWSRSYKASFQMQGGELIVGQNAGDTKYLWELLEQPDGAKGKFADPADAATTFTTNKAGDYKFKLTVSNEAGADETLVNGVVFVKDKAPADAGLYEMPIDRIEGRMVAASPERAAALKGKSIAPVAYWSFDEPAGKAAKGTGPKAKEIELADTVTYTAKGKFGGALHIVPEKKKDAVLDFGAYPELSNEFTISFWAISERDNLKAAFFHAKGENGKEFWRLKNSHNSSKVPGYSALRFDGQIGSPIRIEGHWTHFVISYSKFGEYKKLYINGWLAGSSPNLGVNKDATGVPQLIFNNTGDNYSFKGMLDEVAIYDKMLNSDEVYKIYTGGVTSLEKRVAVDPYTTRAYTEDFIKKYFPEPEFQYRAEGFAEERFAGGTLSPYTHPRLNMTLEDLPRIRQSFLKSRQGNNHNSFLYLWTRTQFGDELQNCGPNSALQDAKPPHFNKDAKKINGKYPTHNTGNEATGRIALAYEALLRADSDLARMLIENMLKSAVIQQELIDHWRAKGEPGWQHSYHDILGRRSMALMYDYLYNWMKPEEKAVLRKVIADATAGNWSIGMYAMPALNAHRSNWQAWITGDFMIANQAIYGEQGFCQFTYDQAARAVELCAEIMNDPESGAHYEGMGKSNINSTQMSVLARTQPAGKKIISSKALYNNVAKFHLHTALPWDNRIVMYDQKNGGNSRMPSSPINVLHYAYPNDPIINFLKHCVDQGSESYTSMRPRTFGQESWMISAIYTQDWDGPEDIREHLKYAVEKAGEPLGYFSDFRGQMISRSSWEDDALQLYYVPRVIQGGHHAPCKGYFRVNGLERCWIIFRSRSNHHTRTNSCVTVDGVGQDYTVAKSLSYSGAAKDKGAAFDILSSDLTGCYRQISNMWPSLNYTRLEPDKRPWFDMPKEYLVNWYHGDRPHISVLDDKEPFDAVNYKGKEEFDYAYRTAALGRGEHPYILIVDDFKKDDKQREYIWHAALDDELKGNLTAHKVNGDTAILTDPKDKTKHLLVKMFGYQGAGEFVIEHIVPTQDVDRAKMNLTIEQMPHNLKFKNQTNTAKFRALIYAFKDGDPMPTISGKDDNFKITIGKQTDKLTIVKASAGNPEVKLTRVK